MKRLFRAMGIDRAVGFTLLTSLFNLFAKPVNLVMIVLFLSEEQQGYMTAFYSLLGLQSFFELGLGVVLVQFFSHEFARLRWSPERGIEGDAASKARIGSLFQTSFRVYAVVTLAAVPAMAAAGLAFFGRKPGVEAVSWQIPWLLYVLFLGVNLIQTPLNTLIIGSGSMASIARMQTLATVAGTLLYWLALWLGTGLYAALANSLIGVIFYASWIYLAAWGLVREAYRLPRTHISISWRREVWPLQWRVAVSWLSNYFAVYAVALIIFQRQGAAEAGRIGMSIGISYTLAAIGATWLSARVPTFGVLVGAGRIGELDRLFAKTVIQTCAVIVAVGAAFVGCLIALDWYGSRHVHRVVGPATFAVLIASALASALLNAGTCYLRAFKSEPLMFVNLAVGCSTVVVCLLTTGRNPLWLASGMLAANVAVGLGFGSLIFARARRRLIARVSQTASRGI